MPARVVVLLPRLLRTVSVRLAALYVVVFALSALVLGIAVFVETRTALRHGMQARIEAETTFLRGEFAGGGLTRLRAVIDARGRTVNALDYLLQGPDGRSLAGDIAAVAAPRAGWTRFTAYNAASDDRGPEMVLALMSPLPGGAWMAVAEDLSQVAEVQEAIASAFLWSVGLAAVLGIGGGVWLARAFLRRVDSIARTAEAIIGGDLARRVPVGGTGDDLDRLAATLNRMLDRIGALMDSLRQVSVDVAHDLRTPLSRLYQRLEEARSEARSPQDADTIEAAMAEADGLLQTFSALLRIAQVEGASPRAGFATLDLGALAESVADAYRPDMEEAGLVLSVSAPPRMTLRGDRELLTQALANLLENALRHTPRGTHIAVTLRAEPDGGATLAVGDDGPGVGEADLPHLTDRFFRGESSRTTPGNGLGLSLVAAVADLHGATLHIVAKQPGLLVSLMFAGPIGRPEPALAGRALPGAARG